MIELIKVEKAIYRNYCSEFINAPISLNPDFDDIQRQFEFISSFYVLLEKGKCIGLLPIYKKKNIHYSVPFFSYGLYFDAKLSEEKLIRIKELLTENFTHFKIKLISTHQHDLTSDKITAFLQLKNNIDEQLASFKSKLRSQIKKGYKNEIKAIIGNKELINSFYAIYCKNMNELGSPPYSKSFFEKIIDKLPKDQTSIYVVTKDTIPIGSSICISYNGFTEVVWASTLAKYNSQSSNMVLYWEMISYAIKKNQQLFSFGRSDVNSSQLRFKEQWGVETKPIIYINSGKSFIKLSVLKKYFRSIWKMIPYKIANLIGPIISERIY